jgi:hypothetical protein
MKTSNINSRFFKWASILSLIIIGMYSCNNDILDETPLSSLNDDITLSSKSGFEASLVGLVRNAREEYTQDDATVWFTNYIGTDIGDSAGQEFTAYRDWVSYITPIRGEVRANWNWAYSKMIPQANTIISYANRPELQDIWSQDAEKNAVIAEARFFRGYTYNLLANLYGGVPIVESLATTIKFDYERSTRQQVYEFAKKDLEFASQWLPVTVAVNKEGRIIKAAADHLLTEVNISLGAYDDAVTSASAVINSGLYELMTMRFGSKADLPGDVFSDLFAEGNQNRSSGNLESIYVWQIENNTAGGGGSRDGNAAIRNFAPFLTKIKDPKNVFNIPTDSLGRGVGRTRGSNYSIYDIWKNDANDIRNSKYNFKRDFYYNNPNSSFFGQIIEPKTVKEDTMRNIYPYPRKMEGPPWASNPASGRTIKDIYVYRLAETFLLRAEAYFRKGDLSNAAADINTVRNRANANSINAETVTLNFILDERARELMYETSRRRTLIRMGILVERVRNYGFLESARKTIQDYHNLWPIPQEAIDANFGAELKQNPGY